MPDKVISVRYERQGDLVRFTMSNMTNHELREIMVGLWARMDRLDKVDHIRELEHYLTERKSWFSGIARAVQSNPGDDFVIDLSTLIQRGENIAP